MKHKDIKELNLTMSEWFIYKLVIKRPGIKNQDVANDYYLNKATTLQVFKKLQSKNLIKGIRNEKDNREILYYKI